MLPPLILMLVAVANATLAVWSAFNRRPRWAMAHLAALAVCICRLRNGW